MRTKAKLRADRIRELRDRINTTSTTDSLAVMEILSETVDLIAELNEEIRNTPKVV